MPRANRIVVGGQTLFSKILQTLNPFHGPSIDAKCGHSYYDHLFDSSLEVLYINENRRLIFVEYEDGDSHVFTFQWWDWLVESGRFETPLQA